MEVKNEESKKTTKKSEKAKKDLENKEKFKKVSDNKGTQKKEIHKKTNNKPAKNAILGNKKGIIIVAIMVLIMILIIGVGYPLTLKMSKESSLKEIDNIFTAIKSGDEETIKKYLNKEDYSSDNGNDEQTEMMKIVLKDLNYEIVSTDASLNKNIVKVNVTNKNLKEVFSNYMKKRLSLAFSKAFNRMTEKEMNEKVEKAFEEQYDSEDIEKITKEITITMERKSGKWKMETDKEEFVKAILPEYESIMN